MCNRVFPDHMKTSVKLSVARQFENEGLTECVPDI